MSNKRKSYFLLIRVKVKHRIGFIIPIPLMVIDEAVGAMVYMSSLIMLVCRLFCGNIKVCGLVKTFIELVPVIVSEIRHYGRLKLVEVDTEEAKVSIDFY